MDQDSLGERPRLFRSTCPACGDVVLEPDELTLVGDFGGLAAYEFTCGRCMQLVHKRADEKTVQLLVANGISPRGVAVGETIAPNNDPPFCVDDVIDFHFSLESDQWLETALETMPGSTAVTEEEAEPAPPRSGWKHRVSRWLKSSNPYWNLRSS